MKPFFEHPAVQAISLLAAALAIVQFVAPYLVAPVSLTFTPIFGAVTGLVAAVLLIYARAAKSATWTKSKVIFCFSANAALFGINIAFQIFLYVITNAERAESFEFANRMHGIVIKYLELLPPIYLCVIAICFYSAVSAVYWLYRWMKT